MNPIILGIIIIGLIFLILLIGVHILVVHTPKLAEQLPFGIKLVHYYGMKCVPLSKKTSWCCKIRVKTAANPGVISMNYFMFKNLLDNIQKTIKEIKIVSKIHPEINDDKAIKSDLYNVNIQLNTIIDEIKYRDLNKQDVNTDNEIKKALESSIKTTQDHIETDPDIEKLKFDNQIDELESKIKFISDGPYLQYYNFVWLDKILNEITHELLFQQIVINNEISHDVKGHFIPIPEIENSNGFMTMQRLYPGKSTKEYSLSSVMESLTNLKCPRAVYYEPFMGERQVSTPPQNPYFNPKRSYPYFGQ